MVLPNRKAQTIKKLLVLGLILIELATLIIMESYKYYYNFNTSEVYSHQFLKNLSENFNLFYIGNLFWLLLFIVSVTALINIFLKTERVNESALRVLFLFSALLIGILILAIYLPGSDSIDNLTGKIIQLNTKGTKIILLSLFSILKVFITVSETVISFSALKKYYIFRSIWLTIFVVFTGLLIIFASIYYYKDDYNDIVSKGYKLDAGVVLGAAVWGGNRPSPVLRERINKGAELYYAGAVKNIVLTGGGAPGEMTEAEVAKNELLKKGVNEANIFIENKSNSTLEQVTYINQNLYRKNNWKEIALITDNFHLFRSKQICRFFGMNVKTVASDTPLSTESTFYYSVKESFAIVLFWLFGIG
jgi:vancomycin permeability regulator SanA